MCATPYSYVHPPRPNRHVYMRGITRSMRTGWRRLIGSPKLQIIFHKRATKYRALLRKMTYKDKGSYESSPPCTRMYAHVWLPSFIRTPTLLFPIVTCICVALLILCVALLILCIPWCINMRDLPYSYIHTHTLLVPIFTCICMASLILCVPWCIHTCGMTRS